MSQVTKVVPFSQASSRDILSEVCREGAQKMLAVALEAEIAEFIQRFESLRDESGQRLVVRNGHHPARKILSGNGQVEVHQPRVNDKRVDADGNRLPIDLFPRNSLNVDDVFEAVYGGDLTLAAFVGAAGDGYFVVFADRD